MATSPSTAQPKWSPGRFTKTTASVVCEARYDSRYGFFGVCFHS